jgi:GntR family transcriptional regulator, rspAB operon transcriptional repressor
MSIVPQVRHPGLVDQLVEHVFDAVVSGRLKHGSELTEDQIATDFGVSRTPVREAVRRLAEMGVLVVRPRCGLEVASFDANDLEQIAVLRAELECLALKLAIARMIDVEIEAIAQAVSECESKLKSKDRIDIFRADSRFHLLIAEFSGNLHLADTLRRLDVKVQLCRMVFCASIAKIKSSVHEHRPLLDAIRKRDAREATKLLRAHILQSIQVFQPSAKSRS